MGWWLSQHAIRGSGTASGPLLRSAHPVTSGMQTAVIHPNCLCVMCICEKRGLPLFVNPTCLAANALEWNGCCMFQRNSNLVSCTDGLAHPERAARFPAGLQWSTHASTCFHVPDCAHLMGAPAWSIFIVTLPRADRCSDEV